MVIRLYFLKLGKWTQLALETVASSYLIILYFSNVFYQKYLKIWNILFNMKFYIHLLIQRKKPLSMKVPRISPPIFRLSSNNYTDEERHYFLIAILCLFMTTAPHVWQICQPEKNAKGQLHVWILDSLCGTTIYTKCFIYLYIYLDIQLYLYLFLF